MFTGLIEKVGQISGIQEIPDALQFKISCEPIAKELNIGDSIAVDGVCLTAIKKEKNNFWVEAVRETLNRTSLCKRKKGDLVNLEQSLRIGQKLGGHFVQGHVDATGTVVGLKQQGSMQWLTVEYPDSLNRYIIEKGSIAIDGISLTVARKERSKISIAIISHTFSNTNLKTKSIADLVNLEVDMMAKYIENMMSPQVKENEAKLSEDWIKEQGF